MEVHAHSHTPRKKWTHYFWEFIMLFLAVFAGFLAENQREHIVEHRRAKVYATNLFQELKKDTSSLQRLISRAEFLAVRLDSFCTLSITPNTSTGALYYYAYYATRINFYASENTTIQQLKSSGNLRLMPNEIAQQISHYENKLSTLENEYQLTKSEFGKLEDLYFRIFDWNTTSQLEGSIRNQNKDSIFKLSIPLINDDPKLMKEFSGWLRFEAGMYRFQVIDFLVPLKKTAELILAMLQKNYHFK